MELVLTPEIVKNKALGDFLYKARTSQDILQKDVEQAIGKQQSHISQIEGYTHLPSLAVLVDYLNAIGYEAVIRNRR